MKNKTISIIVSFFNEEGNIFEHHKVLTKELKKIKNIKFDFIYVDNGSFDKTFENLCKLKKNIKNLKIVKLSKNFKFDGGVMAGISICESDAAIIMTGNLQDDPILIHDFVELWQAGYKNIYGIVQSRPGKTIFRKFNSIIYYKILNLFTKGLIPKGASDFRLIDYKILSELKKLNEYNLFLRGMISWLGFKSVGIEYYRKKRFSGKSHAKFIPVLRFALNGIFSFSSVPLRSASFISFFSAFFSILLLAFQIYRWVNYGVPFDGFGSLISLMLLLFSIICLLFAILFNYINLIYDETKKRPKFVIEEII